MNKDVSLTHFGYRFKKEQLTKEELGHLRVMVKATAVKGYGLPPKPFGIYKETENTISVPYYFGKEYLENGNSRGVATYRRMKDKSADTSATNAAFNGILREPQERLISAVMKHFESEPRCMITAGTGQGKCMGIDTPIMMFSGKIKKVQDVCVGDLLMGDDSQPRRVLSLARGRDEMYEIKQTKGDTYVVNKEHILCLVKLGWNPRIIEIPVKNYLRLPDNVKGTLRGYKVRVRNGNDGGGGGPSKGLDDLSTISSISCITTKHIGTGDYYGFTLDGNHRYLLGDFTVTHNTVMAINLISRLKKRTLIIVHKQFLLDQWVERIRTFMPMATIGTICQKKFEPEKDIIIGMLQSLSMRDYPEIKDIGTIIVDECHHIGSTVFSKALLKYSAPRMVGLSATPDRKDGLSNVLDWTFGKRFEPENNNQHQQVFINIVRTKAVVVEQMIRWTGVLNTQTAINQLTDDNERTALIINQVRKLYKDNTKCILLVSDRIAHLKYIDQKLKDYDIDSSLYIGGMTTEARELATESRVLCGTYSMVQEAFDSPKLNVLIFATPKRDIVQVTGRILRKIHTTSPPIIIDIFDPVSVFERWGFERFKFYKKRGYKMNKVPELSSKEPEVELEYLFDD